MEERNRLLRTASHLEQLLRRRHSHYVANRATPRDLTIVVRNAANTFAGRASRFRVTCARRAANCALHLRHSRHPWRSRARTGSALDERVVDVLNVVVLLELVDHREGFGGFRLRQLDW